MKRKSRLDCVCREEPCSWEGSGVGTVVRLGACELLAVVRRWRSLRA